MSVAIVNFRSCNSEDNLGMSYRKAKLIIDGKDEAKEKDENLSELALILSNMTKKNKR